MDINDMMLDLMANPYNMKPKKQYHRKNYLSMYLLDRYDERDERVVRFIESHIDDLIVEYVLNDIIDQINLSKS